MATFCSKIGCRNLACWHHIYVLNGDIRLTADSCREHEKEVGEELTKDGKQFEKEIKK